MSPPGPTNRVPCRGASYTLAAASNLAFSDSTFAAETSGPPATNARKKAPRGTKVSFKHFTGRLNGRKLKPGPYRLVATPTAGGKTGKPASRAFRIVR